VDLHLRLGGGGEAMAFKCFTDTTGVYRTWPYVYVN
jgi:hypothetical protein